MKRRVIILVLVVFLSSFISADIIFTQPVNSVYNLGDVINVPVTIKTTTDVTGSFNMDLICNGTTVNFYKYSGIKLSAGDEKNLDSSLVLVDKIINNQRGMCKIKASMSNGDSVLSNEFKISDALSITGNLTKSNFNPDDIIIITGNATKEKGENLNGFVEADILTDNKVITQSGTVTDGIFSLNISLPGNVKAGNYLILIKAFEKNSDEGVTNSGNISYNISVNQVPTNLELILDSRNISPGTNVNISAILHDQTGNPMSSAVFITIKDSDNKILEQREVQTGESFEYPIKNNEPPAKWKIVAVSNQLTAENNFNIIAVENASIEIINKTVLVTNTGNVIYNKTLLVKIGDTPLNIDVFLNVGESKKYGLSAPDGQYAVEVSSNGNDVSKIVSLTGNAVNVKEISGSFIENPIWILSILILAIVVFLILRKIYKKPFVGKNNMNFRKKDNREIPVLGATSISRPVNRAEISLSIKEGEKQDASVICLRVKNLKEMKAEKGSVSESIEKIKGIAEENKAVIYENLDYLFIILAPTKTRTFKNEKTALDMSESINKILIEHNKMFNQKVDFGISLNSGAIVAKIENGIFKFMAMGTLMGTTKKIAALAKEEILLGEKMNDLLRLNIRTEKSMRNGTAVFKITEIKRENRDAMKFIDSFMRRQGKE